MPNSKCEQCNGKVKAYNQPSYRHQVFELPKQDFDITEYQVYHGKCSCCEAVTKGKIPATASATQMGPNLLSYISILTGQYHLSVRKVQSLLQSQFGNTFSIGAISEAQGRVSNMLTPTHQALHHAIKKAPIVHVDETTHHRNNQAQTLWVWLASADDIVFQKIMSSRRQECAQYILGKKFNGIAVTDQCGSYNWIDKNKHQFCWAHIIRDLQKMADYSGKGLTANIGEKLVLICKIIFRVQHRYQNKELSKNQYHKRMQRLRKSFNALLFKGKTVPCKRYAGRCAFISKYETSLWVFLSNPDIPLTNNEAERCIRGSVILRKNSYGTSSERGEQFRSRVLSVVETCKKRKISALEVISSIVGAVIRREPYPDVFNLLKT